jgi:hypothetical protein
MIRVPGRLDQRRDGDLGVRPEPEQGDGRGVARARVGVAECRGQGRSDVSDVGIVILIEPEEGQDLRGTGADAGVPIVQRREQRRDLRPGLRADLAEFRQRREPCVGIEGAEPPGLGQGRVVDARAILHHREERRRRRDQAEHVSQLDPKSRGLHGSASPKSFGEWDAAIL